MPGFNIQGNGGNGPSNTSEPRRKHRWVWQSVGQTATSRILVYLKTAQRPHGKFNEAIMHHNQEQAYFAGKTEWDPITLTWYDIEQPADVSKQVWTWWNSVSDIPTANVALPSSYKRQSTLTMIGGAGTVNEKWTLYGSWPQDTNFQELDYTTSDIQEIQVMLRFDRAVRGGAAGSADKDSDKADDEKSTAAAAPDAQ